MESLRPVEWCYLLVALLLLILSGVFSAAEIGLLSVNRFRVHQLAEGGSPRARLVRRLLERPARPLTAILIAITTMKYVNESLVTHWLTGPARHYPAWVPFAALLVLVLIFAEMTPISYAAANPETVALATAPLVAFCNTLFRPLVVAFTAVAALFLRLLGGEPRQRPLVTGEEVRTVVDIETERGVIEEEEQALIHSIFEFSDTVVREIMVPRIDIVAIDEEQTIGEAVDLTTEHRISRLPVYRNDLDHVIGLVHVKDLLPFAYREQLRASVAEAMRPVTFVPETKGVSELLRELRETKQALAIVLDEYGGTAGLVTVEDLLEEIVGEIYDEYDIEEKLFERLDEQTFLVDGRLAVDELSELLDHALPEGEYDTVGGLLYTTFGDVPSVGEQVDVDGYRFIVEQLDGHRIAKVRIVMPKTFLSEP